MLDYLRTVGSDGFIQLRRQIALRACVAAPGARRNLAIPMHEAQFAANSPVFCSKLPFEHAFPHAAPGRHPAIPMHEAQFATGAATFCSESPFVHAFPHAAPGRHPAIPMHEAQSAAHDSATHRTKRRMGRYPMRLRSRLQPYAVKMAQCLPAACFTTSSSGPTASAAAQQVDTHSGLGSFA